MYSDSNENHAPRSSHRLETDDRSIDQYLDELIAGPFLLVLLVCVCVWQAFSSSCSSPCWRDWCYGFDSANLHQIVKRQRIYKQVRWPKLDYGVFGQDFTAVAISIQLDTFKWSIYRRIDWPWLNVYLKVLSWSVWGSATPSIGLNSYPSDDVLFPKIEVFYRKV